MSHEELAGLLLAHQGGGPLLASGTSVASAATTATTVEVHKGLGMADLGAAASDLQKQRWAVVVTDDDRGRRLESLVAPLVAKRAADQRDEVMVVRVPPGMDSAAAGAWRSRVYPSMFHGQEAPRPRFLLLLGDFDAAGISLETQQVLALDGFPGRLVCADDTGYEAYVAKVLARERADEAARPRPPRLGFFTVRDGTSATEQAHRYLIEPCLTMCRSVRERDHRQLPVESIEEAGGDVPDPDELFDLAGAEHPLVLLSVSHGLGPPPGVRWSDSAARQRQGAIHFGDANEPILPVDVARGSFLPGGFWAYFACLGAGTPSRSLFHHWLKSLPSSDRGSSAAVAQVLDVVGQHGAFTSGIAQAALANPDGPVGVLGHVDLAWTYSYREIHVDDRGSLQATARHQGFYEMMAKLAQRERVGTVYLALQQAAQRVGNELNERYDEAQRSSAQSAEERAAAQRAMGHLWMLRQDLSGYMLLGDPAARVSGAPLPAPSSAVPEIGGGDVGAGDVGESLSEDQLNDLEDAVFRLSLGDERGVDIEASLGLEPGRANEMERAYREAGREALRRLFTRG